jgi:uncharacterized repeat protein (TIGR01451 family)
VLLLWSSAPTGQSVPGVTGVSAQGLTDTPTVTSTPTATATRTPTATPNQDCVLHVTKDDNVSEVPEGGTITYTITVDNNGDNSSGECDNLTVTDTIPDDTDCTDASVSDDSDISESHFDINGCDSSGDVTWETSSNLGTDSSVVLTMVVELTDGASDGDTITNEACADSDNASGEDCDSVDTDVSGVATATPAPTATTAPAAPIATARPIVPPPVVPQAVTAPLVIPNTGSGPGSSGNSALALALGLTGGALLLLGGTGVWLRRRS